MLYSDALKCVDDVIAKVGMDIVLGTPLGVGKPNHILNAFYQRAKENPDLKLKIVTALTFEKPKGKSLLESRFLAPFADRVFGNYPNLDFELDRIKNALPANVQVLEFYFIPGKYKNNKNAQRNYISSNYTHIYRDMIAHEINVLAQMICEGEIEGEKYYNLSCNPDVSLDVIRFLKNKDKADTPTAIIGQINDQLPFMFGDAVINKDDFDFVLNNSDFYFKPFSTPKMKITEADYMIGLFASTLVKDDGELQIGIGTLGDAIVYALKLRQQNNDSYLKILQRFNIDEKFGNTIKKLGETSTFTIGLHGETEMLFDGFMHLWDCGIMKKKVYNDAYIQRLLNEGAIEERVSMKTLDLLLERHVIHPILSELDFYYLQRFGILKGSQILKFDSGVLKLKDGREIQARLDDAEYRQQIEEFCLGNELKNGAIIQAAFFLGEQKFYQWLKELPEEERKLIHMKSVRSINQLYGHEEIDRLHMKNARFFNTCLKMTLSGAAASDGLEDGTVISGVGGQYNFVAMAHELNGGYSIIQLRSTKGEGKKLSSNIVWNYGHTTIPRHLRDIVITEYGIADLRGKSDEEIIKALLNIADSRFQNQLIQKAKRAGKLHKDYQIPEMFRNNFPKSYSPIIQELTLEDFFQPFPFGSDFTDEELIIGKALKLLKKKTDTKIGIIGTVIKAISAGWRVPITLQPYLKRMNLQHPNSLQEMLYQRLLINALKEVIIKVNHF